MKGKCMARPGDVSEKITSAALTCVIGLYLICFCIINFCGFDYFCTADIYGDTLLARLMWESGTLFPENWIFGNQFYVITTQVLAAPIYGLCGSANLALVISTSLLTVLIMLSFWWLVSPFADRRGVLLGILVLMGSIISYDIVNQKEGQIFYMMASFYSSYLIVTLLVFGIYARLATEKKVSSILFVLTLILSFCSGMQSLRQTAMTICPMVCLEGLHMLGRLFRKERLSVLLRSRRFLATVLYTVSNLLGCVYIRILDPAYISIYGDITLTSGSRMQESVKACLDSIGTITGIKYLWEDHVGLGLIAVVMILIGVTAAVMVLRERKNSQEKVLLALCALGFAITMASTLILNVSLQSRYLFIWYLFAAISAVVVYRRVGSSKKAILCSIVAAATLCNLWGSYGENIRQALEEDTTYHKQVSEYVVEEEYEIIYGEWYEVCQIAAYTDGKILPGCWYNNACEILGYINLTDIYSEEDVQNAVYMVIPRNEEMFMERVEECGATLEWVASFNNDKVNLYRSDKQLMYIPEASQP